MDFDQKEKLNIRRHKVSFDEASTVFDDPLSRTFDDPDHSINEQRFIIIGHSNKNRLLFISHTDDGEVVRIISVREVLPVNENIMKKNEMLDDLRPEYDLSQLKNHIRGKYVDRYREGTNVVLLEPEVHAAFPDSESVNSALKLLIKLAKKEVQGRTP